MKLYKMIEMYLKYDNMHTNVIINTFICINNHVNSCIKCMLSAVQPKIRGPKNTVIHPQDVFGLKSKDHMYFHDINQLD